jgi:hypothetical protein
LFLTDKLFKISNMRGVVYFRVRLLVSTILFLSLSSAAQSQTSDESKQFWPAFNASFELSSRSRITAILEKHKGEDSLFDQWKVGAIFTVRVRRLGQQLRHDVDKENEYNLVLGGGYQFVKTDQNGGNKDEHRLLLQVTPKYFLFAGILAQDRSQFEFRWINGTYNFRYRNKLTIERTFKINKVRFNPYASGELFWDRNHHAWNQNQYAFGVRWPYKKSFVLDTYYLHQNCTTCSLDPINVLGVTAKVYFAWPYK